DLPPVVTHKFSPPTQRTILWKRNLCELCTLCASAVNSGLARRWYRDSTNGITQPLETTARGALASGTAPFARRHFCCIEAAETAPHGDGRRQVWNGNRLWAPRASCSA